MKKVHLTYILYLLSLEFIIGQQARELLYTGTNGTFYKIIPYGDGFVTSGNAIFNGTVNNLIVRLDSSGFPIWGKVFPGMNNDNIKSIAIDTKERILCLGTYSDSASFNNLFVTRTDSTGSSFQELILGKQTDNYVARTIKTTDDNGAVILYDYELNTILARLDSNLQIQWCKSVYGRMADFELINNRIVLSGNNTLDDYLMESFDMSGNILWTKKLVSAYIDYGGEIYYDQVSKRILCLGRSVNPLGNDPFAVVYATDTLGNFQWAHMFSDTCGMLRFNEIENSVNSQYIEVAADVFYPSPIYNNAIRIKMDLYGNIVGLIEYGDNSSQAFYSLATNSILGKTIYCGFNCIQCVTGSNYLVFPNDSVGDFCFEKHPPIQSFVLNMNSFAQTNVPTVDYNDSVRNIFVNPVNASNIVMLLCVTGIDSQYEKKTFDIYPNPCSGVIHIENGGGRKCGMEIIDIKGNMICRIPIYDSNEYKLPDNMVNGVYFLKLLDEENGTTYSKMILIRE